MLQSWGSLNQQPWSSPYPTLALLPKCKTPNEINQLHAGLVKTGLIMDPTLTTRIILSLAPSPHAPLVHFARRLFFTRHAPPRDDGEQPPDPFLWNAVIKSYSHGDDPRGALRVLCLMLENGVLVDRFSLSLAFKACSRAGLVREGMQVHGLLRKLILGSDLFLQNCLIGLYMRCGCSGLACQVFDRMARRDSVTYNSMIDGCVKLGRIDLARDLFEVMPSEDKNVTTWNSLIGGYAKLEGGIDVAWELFEGMPERDLVSWNLMIDGCTKCGRMGEAQALFDGMPGRDVVSWANLIDGYLKLGRVELARSLYDRMPERDVVVCNAMMGGYVLNGYLVEALDVFYGMETETKLLPDDTTLLIALSAVAQLGRIDKGMAIHCYMLENGFSLHGRLGVGLIDMYSKCGCIEKAMLVFDHVNGLSVDHFNAMIGGLAIHGLGESAFGLLLEMERMSIEPDDITFISLLNACGHAGLIKEGIMCFELMRRVHNIQPKVQHYGCMVDILCRAGLIEVARKFVEDMPIEPNDIILRTLLSACQNHDIFDTGKHVANLLFNLNSSSPSSCVLLSNMYAALGMWNEVSRVRSAMKERKLEKIPGCSWMELDGKVHGFLVQDNSHPQVTEVYSLLDSLSMPALEASHCAKHVLF